MVTPNPFTQPRQGGNTSVQQAYLQRNPLSEQPAVNTRSAEEALILRMNSIIGGQQGRRQQVSMDQFRDQFRDQAGFDAFAQRANEAGFDPANLLASRNQAIQTYQAAGDDQRMLGGAMMLAPFAVMGGAALAGGAAAGGSGGGAAAAGSGGGAGGLTGVSVPASASTMSAGGAGGAILPGAGSAAAAPASAGMASMPALGGAAGGSAAGGATAAGGNAAGGSGMANNLFGLGQDSFMGNVAGFLNSPGGQAVLGGLGAATGNEGTPSQVVDTTPDQFAAMRQPLAQQLMQQMQNPAQFQGPFAAPMAQGEQQALGNVQQQAGQVGQGQQPAMQMLQQGAQQNPFAGLAPEEQQAMQQVMQQALGQSPMQGQAQNFLGQQLQGQMNPFAQVSSPEQQGVNQIQQTAFGQSPLQSTTQDQLQQLAGTGTHPQLDAMIDAATRPIRQQSEDQLLQQRSQFNQAGQQVQAEGSSPFAQAEARRQTGLANALGDTATEVTQALNQQQQQAQLQALGMAQQQPGMELQNQLAGLEAVGMPRELQQQAFGQMQQNQFTAAGMGDQLAGNALQRALAGLEAAGTGQERQMQAFESGAQRELQAGGQMGQQQLATDQAQLQAQLSNLEAQGLPRMIEQMGLQTGLQEFQRQRDELMQMIATGGNLATGQQATLPGTAGSPGFFGGFTAGLMGSGQQAA